MGEDLQDRKPVEVSEQKPRSRGGRPKYEPNLTDRNAVRLMKADGWADDRIARRLKISRNTLLKAYREELQDGADAVREIALRNLMRASNKGNVAASNALLKLSGLEPPTPTAPERKPDAPPAEKIGKKEAAKIAAQTAEVDTSWHTLMSDGPAN